MQLDASKFQILMKDFFLPPDSKPLFISFAHIKVLDCDIVVEALLNSETFVCFINKNFATKHNIVLVKKGHLAPIKVIDGRPLALGNVVEETKPLEIILGNHISHVVFNII